MMRHLFRNPFVVIALGSWFVPLLIGLAIYASWLVTRNDRLAYMGFAAILIGVLGTATGLVAAIIYPVRPSTIRGPVRALVVLGLVALLLSNYAVAANIISAANRRAGPARLHIRNFADVRIDHVVVTAGSQHYPVGHIPPDSEAIVLLHAPERLPVRFRVEYAGVAVDTPTIMDVQNAVVTGDYTAFILEEDGAIKVVARSDD